MPNSSIVPRIQILRFDANPEKRFMKKYRCKVCGFIYDPTVGDPSTGIPANTPFEDIPSNWCCPICGVTKEDFVEVE